MSNLLFMYMTKHTSKGNGVNLESDDQYCHLFDIEACAQNGTHVHKMGHFGAQNGTLLEDFK